MQITQNWTCQTRYNFRQLKRCEVQLDKKSFNVDVEHRKSIWFRPTSSFFSTNGREKTENLDFSWDCNFGRLRRWNFSRSWNFQLKNYPLTMLWQRPSSNLLAWKQLVALEERVQGSHNTRRSQTFKNPKHCGSNRITLKFMFSGSWFRFPDFNCKQFLNICISIVLLYQQPNPMKASIWKIAKLWTNLFCLESFLFPFSGSSSNKEH